MLKSHRRKKLVEGFKKVLEEVKKSKESNSN